MHSLFVVIRRSKREWFEAKLGKLAAERAAQANGRALEPRLEVRMAWGSYACHLHLAAA